MERSYDVPLPASIDRFGRFSLAAQKEDASLELSGRLGMPTGMGTFSISDAGPTGGSCSAEGAFAVRWQHA